MSLSLKPECCAVPEGKTVETPLKKARGMGASHSGVHHWWMQRLTAIAMVPLGIWLLYSLSGMPAYNQAMVVSWLEEPCSALFLISFIIAAFYHAVIGCETVIDDYVHTKWKHLSLLICLKLFSFYFALTAIYAVLYINFKLVG